MPRVKTHTDEQLKTSHKLSAEKYRKANLDRYRAYSKIYYQKNKEKIRERRRLRAEKVAHMLKKLEQWSKEQ